MIVLDTKVVSELLRQVPHPAVLRWVDEQRSAELTLTAVTVAELRAGVAMLPRGRRRAVFAERIESILQDAFGGEALAFDVGATGYYADIVATRKHSGLPIHALDAEIAAICQRHGAALATRNVADFSNVGVELINPWTE